MIRTKSMATDLTPTLTPKLRFPEFRSESGWGAKSGNELFDQISNREAPLGLPILAITQEHGAIPRGEINYHVSVTDKSVETYKEVRAGDFIISLRSFQGGIEYSNYHGICSPAYVILRKKVELSDTFFKYLFKSYSFIQQLTKNLEGLRDGKMISYKQFSELLLPLPTFAEQGKIAECLSTLDELIGAESQKLDALKTHKQGLMQQLFPREGETVPRIRFLEFENAPEWNQKKLGSVGDVLMCKRIFANETNDTGGVPFYKIGTLGGVADAFISKAQFEDYKARYHFPRVGEVLITCSGTVGKCLPYDGREAYYQDSNIVWIDNPSEEVSNEFLLRILSSVSWGSLNSTTITRIYGPDLKGLEIRFPSDASEQQRIASFLSSIDELISAHACKLEALKTQKQGLMQQLFPRPRSAEA